MKNLSTQLLGLGAAAMCAAPTMAGVVNDTVLDLANGAASQKIVLEDAAWSLDPTGTGDASNLVVDSPVFGFVRVDNLALGAGALDPANPVSGEIDADVAQISIEGFLTATVGFVGQDTITLSNVLVEIYTLDNATADNIDPSDDFASAKAKFTNNNAIPAVTFGLGDADDFYTLKIENGKIAEFELALSVISNNSFVGIQSGVLQDGTTADLYGQGEIQYGSGGAPTTTGNANQFVRGDGKFAIIVPEPASLALLGLGGLAMIRRR